MKVILLKIGQDRFYRWNNWCQRGFARNYLISNKKALYASKENIKEVEKIKNELNKKDQEKKNAKQIYEILKTKSMK